MKHIQLHSLSKVGHIHMKNDLLEVRPTKYLLLFVVTIFSVKH